MLRNVNCECFNRSWEWILPSVWILIFKFCYCGDSAVLTRYSIQNYDHFFAKQSQCKPQTNDSIWCRIAALNHMLNWTEPINRSDIFVRCGELNTVRVNLFIEWSVRCSCLEGVRREKYDIIRKKGFSSGRTICRRWHAGNKHVLAESMLMAPPSRQLHNNIKTHFLVTHCVWSVDEIWRRCAVIRNEGQHFMSIRMDHQAFKCTVGL